MKKKYKKLVIFAVLGAVAGFVYYYFIGCYNGQCPISSNPYISTVYGMAAGLLLGWENKKKPEAENS
jgi:hypothetical protein